MLRRAVRFILSFLLLAGSILGAPAHAQSAGQVRLHIVDPSRADPVDPSHRREWLVTLFYPSEGSHEPNGSYAGDVELVKVLAEQGYYDTPKAEIESWAKAQAPAGEGVPAARSRLPLITLSPGMGVAAFNYSRLAAALASRGFAVAVIDHPYSGISRLPERRVLRAEDYPILANEDMKSWRPAIIDWAKDISFTLDRLSKSGALSPGLELDARQAVAVGHSLGGTIALEACEQEPRLVACANFEGTPEGTIVAERGPSKPILFVGSRSGKPDRPHVAPPVDRPPYSDLAKGNGPATWLVAVRGGSHMSYSDAPFVMPATLSRFGGELMAAERSMQVYVGMTEQFARTYLSGSSGDALSAWLDATPEVKHRLLKSGPAAERAR